MRVVFRVLLLLAATGAAVTADAAAGLSARVKVSPAVGGVRTVFVVRFRAPDRTGVAGSQRRFDVLSATAASSAAGGGCRSSISVSIPPESKGSLVTVRLDARKPAQAWCVGSYRGKIEELESPVCPHGEACPTYVRLVGTVGHFAFAVRAAPPPVPTGDTTPPSFAGLRSAFACTPGPQRPGQTTPFTLSWNAASDNVTPDSQIVYDVYLASTPGGENFSAPSWTTPPGVTTFKTPGLPSHGSFYFVVRASDAAGNEDRNTIEVRGSDPCL